MEDALWTRLRAATPSRIGLGRAGAGVPTSAELRFRVAHAHARDAVRQELDVEALACALRTLGLGEPTHVASRAGDREEYLRRPDLGRVPRTASALVAGGHDLGVVCADGLSAGATQAHAVPVLTALLRDLRLTVAPPVIATGARVALGDHVGRGLGVRVVLVLIGERPGLSAADSLGAYLTHDPRPGRVDSERNCVSNIRWPGGLAAQQAADVLGGLLRQILQLGESGVRVKDRSRSLPGRDAGWTLPNS